MGIKPALFWLSFLSILGVFWKLLDLPPEEEMIQIVSDWIRMYGLWIVLWGSLMEALLFVGFYFPGSLVIFLSVALSATPLAASINVVAVIIGMFMGHSINYMLGKYGWYKIFLKLGMQDGIKNAQVKMEKNEVRYIFYTYWNPGLASFTSTAAGILQRPFSRFLMMMLVALLLWNTFWGILVYSLGESALAILDITFILKIVAIWVVFELCILLKRRFKLREEIVKKF